MFTLGLIIIYGFELLVLYIMACIFNVMVAEYYKKPIAKWNKLSKILE